MPKKILIANTDAQNILALSELFNSLALDDYALFFYSRNENLKKFCQEQKYFYKKSAGLLGFSSKIFQSALLLLLWPFLIFSLYLLAIFKIKYKIDAIICFSWLEKIIFTPWAKMLKLKVIWLACPGIKQKKLNPLLRFLIRVFCARAQIIAFTQKTADILKASGYKTENLALIRPGIDLNRFARQDNIFHNLAKNNNSHNKNNFYTVGAIADLSEEQEIEIILGGIKKALHVIPNLQLIIIGEGKERKNLAWLAKKMEIGNLVWFVGEQAHLHKWLDSFNIYITAAKDAGLSDIKALLCAMSAGIPAIAPVNHGFDDIISDSQNGLLLEKADSEYFAGGIIKINQDNHLRNKLVQNGKQDIFEKYSSKQMLENFKQFLD